MSLPPPQWPTPQIAQRRSGRPAWQIVLVVLVPVLAVLVLLGAVMDGYNASGVDPQDAAACNTFRLAAADYRDGVLTIGELRSRFQDVDAAADGATGPVAKASRDLLAAATSDIARLPHAIAAMDAACDRVG